MGSKSESFMSGARDMARVGKIPIYGSLDDDNKSLIIECIGIASKSLLTQNRQWCTLLIDSEDRDYEDTVAIRTAMIESGLKFRGVVQAKAHFCGFSLLQYCTWRVGISNSTLLYGYGYFRITNEIHSGIKEGNLYFLDHLRNSLDQTSSDISERSGVSKEVLHEYARFQRVFLAQEAVKIGFLDEVVNFIPKSERPESVE